MEQAGGQSFTGTERVRFMSFDFREWWMNECCVNFEGCLFIMMITGAGVGSEEDTRAFPDISWELWWCGGDQSIVRCWREKIINFCNLGFSVATHMCSDT